MTPSPPNDPPPADSLVSAEETLPLSCSFPVVGVGASAGGLEAFSQLLSALPATTGMAFVLVQHLDRQHESQLVELLSRVTALPVLEARQGLPVEPDHVYVIPPNATLALTGGVLQISPRDEGHRPHLPIDHFFKTLAADRQAAAIGVVLSGTGSDGTLGLEEIKAAGGLTFAQDEASAPHAGMPHSAALGGCVDQVLPPAAIAKELARMGRHPYLSSGTDPVAPTPPDDRELRRILALLHSATGVDFAGYRDSTIKRRVMRRVVLHNRATLSEYARQLETDASEVTALYHDLLINVTRFFRDPECFEALKRSVFPAILMSKDAHNPIRIWAPGCSTGQEAYSLAMALTEFLDGQSLRPPVQIFATDLSDAVSLVKAREGIYPESIEAEVSPERLRRFFTKLDGKYRVQKSLRDLCVFARQNVAADPPFSRVDLISCRNLLIYLAPTLQRRVIPTFHYALNANAFLVLGSAETVGTFSHLFDVVDARHRIYVRRPNAVRSYPHFSTGETFPADLGRSPSAPPAAPGDWKTEADRLVLGNYSPAGVVVNADLDVLQFRGQTGPYLAPAAGEASFNLLRMAREGLLPDLREALDACRRENVAVARPGVQVRGEGQVREIHLRVLPIKSSGPGAGAYLVLFEEARGEVPLSEAAAGGRRGLLGWLQGWLSLRKVLPQVSASSSLSKGNEAASLRRELDATRAYLQSVVERQEANTEELRAANEEILSSNEELQSTNEELQTAKEELQSMNEELTTINEQLESRNREANRLNDDLTNLLGSAAVPMLVVGMDGTIRRFTPATEEILHLRPADVGRPISDLPTIIEVPDLDALVTTATATVQVQEREVCARNGRWYALRVHPYRTADHRIDGAVAVLADIDDAKRAQQGLRAERDYNWAILETVRDPLIVLDAGLCVRSANRAYFEKFGGSPAETEGRPLYAIKAGQWDVPELRRLLEEILPQESALEDFELTFGSGMGRGQVLLLNARRVRREPGEELILLAVEDVTERRRAEAAVRASEVRYRRLFESAQDGILLVDPNTRTISDVNPFLLQFLGYSRDEIVGKELWQIGLLKDETANRAAFDELLRRGSIRYEDLPLQTKDGRRCEVEFVSNVYRENGHAVIQCNIRNITDRKQAELELREAREELERRVEERTAELNGVNSALTAEISAREQAEEDGHQLRLRLTNAQEDERRHIARELHDQMGQYLTALGLGLKTLQEVTPEPTALTVLRHLQQLTDMIGKEVHTLALKLRPTSLDDLGLAVTLANYAEAWSERSGMPVDFQCTGLDRERLPPPVETTLFRVVQEALTNVAKHSRASRVSVTLQRTPQEALAVIEDDGCGFDVTALSSAGVEGRLGLLGMRERLTLLGGTLAVESSGEAGTSVFARIPLSPTDEDRHP